MIAGWLQKPSAQSVSANISSVQVVTETPQVYSGSEQIRSNKSKHPIYIWMFLLKTSGKTANISKYFPTSSSFQQFLGGFLWHSTHLHCPSFQLVFIAAAVEIGGLGGFREGPWQKIGGFDPLIMGYWKRRTEGRTTYIEYYWAKDHVETRWNKIKQVTWGSLALPEIWQQLMRPENSQFSRQETLPHIYQNHFEGVPWCNTWGSI